MGIYIYPVNSMVRKGGKAMYLECKMYPAPDMWEYLGVKNNNAAYKKLSRYGVVCFVNGWGKHATFNIKEIPDPFKLYCVFNMGFEPRSDFRKLRDYLFFLLGDDEYCWLPDEPMEKYMKSKGYPISRQTIAKYRKHLLSLDYIHDGDFIYYRAYRDEYDREHYEQVDKKDYCWAWRLYWDKIGEGWASSQAYAYMYTAFQGVPRKQAKPITNAFHLKELNYLMDLVSKSIEKEVSIRRHC